jgi:L-lactate dehydrogenase (cytochrome)
MADQRLLSARQISEHKTPNDCWVVVDKQVWDVTDFVEEHPGGSASTSMGSPINLLSQGDI